MECWEFQAADLSLQSNHRSIGVLLGASIFRPSIAMPVVCRGACYVRAAMSRICTGCRYTYLVSGNYSCTCAASEARNVLAASIASGRVLAQVSIIRGDDERSQVAVM